MLEILLTAIIANLTAVLVILIASIFSKRIRKNVSLLQISCIILGSALLVQTFTQALNF